jgi:hypothetical protein
MADAHHPAIRTVQSLAVLIDLGRRARRAGSAQELAFQLVNDTHGLVPYRQAVLWAQDTGVQALSGVVQPDANAPYVQWLTQLLDATPVPADRAALTLSASTAPPALAADWAHWLPAHALLLRVPAEGNAAPGTPRTTLLLARDQAWPEEDQRLIGEWVDTWHHAYAATQRPRPAGWRGLGYRLRQHLTPQAGQRWWRQRRLQWLAAVLAVLCLPVRLSVMAPGELVPAQPVVVRAPMEGVIDTFHVQPNQTVSKDQPLFGFDEALIQSRLNVAAQALATAEAEYRQASQQALIDPRSKAQLAVLTGKIEEKRAERDYLQDQLGRARVLAPRDGVALFDDPSEWIGKPVATGERILRIAAADDREVEAWLPVGDAIALGPQAPVKLYLNASPLQPVAAQLRYMAHEAVARPDGSFAYRVRATLTEPTAHRVGLKGTVRLQGDWTPLAYWMLRRPLAALRATLGL